MCLQAGGTQEAMRPAAILSLLGYTIGLPAVFFTILVVHRRAIFEDQTLRQKNLGNDPASNPNFSIRKRYKELYVGLHVNKPPRLLHACSGQRWVLVGTGTSSVRTCLPLLRTGTHSSFQSCTGGA
jgi:hypothetical protein